MLIDSLQGQLKNGLGAVIFDLSYLSIITENCLPQILINFSHTIDNMGIFSNWYPNQPCIAQQPTLLFNYFIWFCNKLKHCLWKKQAKQPAQKYS